MGLGEILKNHWTVNHAPRTPEQDEAEKNLLCFYVGRYITIGKIPFSRWWLFPAAFLIQFSIGSLYSWSVFNKPIDLHLYGDENASNAVIAFYMAVGCFGTASALFGPWAERNGPRLAMMVGTTSLMVGMTICWLSLQAKWDIGLYVGYGVFVGAGSGLCYIAPVSALQKWFPDYRGAAAGFAVGGYGAGSVLWSKVYLPIKDAVGLPFAFFVLGLMMAVTMYISSIALRLPPAGYQVSGLNVHGETVNPNAKNNEASPMHLEEYSPLATAEHAKENSAASSVKKLTLLESIFSIDFMFMYLMFFANQLFGLMVLSKLSGMCVDLFGRSKDTGSTVVSINGIFNCAGRFLLSGTSDIVIRVTKCEAAAARRGIFFVTLGLQLLIVATLPSSIRAENFTIFLVQVWCLTMLYGGGFGSIPCFLTDMFGAYNIGAMHGLILTAWSIGGVGGGILFNAWFKAYKNDLLDSGDYESIKDPELIGEAYILIFHKILIVIIIGFIMLICVRTNPKDRFEAGYHYSICGKRIISLGGHK